MDLHDRQDEAVGHVEALDDLIPGDRDSRRALSPALDFNEPQAPVGFARLDVVADLISSHVTRIMAKFPLKGQDYVHRDPFDGGASRRVVGTWAVPRQAVEQATGYNDGPAHYNRWERLDLGLELQLA